METKKREEKRKKRKQKRNKHTLNKNEVNNLDPNTPKQKEITEHELTPARNSSDAVKGDSSMLASVPLPDSSLPKLSKSSMALSPSKQSKVNRNGHRSNNSSRSIADGKQSLFSFPHSKIFVFHDEFSASSDSSSSGTLLVLGEFEIFQLYTSDVAYLACGGTFVYPLLPKLRIYRDCVNSFVLSLANPLRYWKIQIDSLDENILHCLEAVFIANVNYEHYSFQKPITFPEGENRESTGNFNLGPQFETNYFGEYVNEAPPDSPPSEPLSPPPSSSCIQRVSSEDFIKEPNILKGNSFQEDHLFKNIFPLKQVTSKNCQVTREDLDKTKYLKKSNNDEEHFSDSSSSMDALLDEYEETLSTTRSVKNNLSRKQSFSSFADPAKHFALNNNSSFPIKFHKQDFNDPSAQVQLPKHQTGGSIGNRSRKSSISELYTSVSSWMEPGQSLEFKPRTSRSIRTLSSCHSTNCRSQNFNESYRNSYRSFLQNNSSRTERFEKADKLYNPADRRKHSLPEQLNGLSIQRGSSRLLRSENRGSMRKKGEGLSSLDVFKLLNGREEPQPSLNLHVIGRVFGW